MPLAKGKSSAVVSRNVKTLLEEGKPRDQSIAIAYSKAGMPKKKKKPGK